MSSTKRRKTNEAGSRRPRTVPAEGMNKINTGGKSRENCAPAVLAWQRNYIKEETLVYTQRGELMETQIGENITIIKKKTQTWFITGHLINKEMLRTVMSTDGWNESRRMEELPKKNTEEIQWKKI